MSQVLGPTHGLKKAMIRRLEKLLQRSVGADVFVSPALAEEVCELSLELHQPLSLLLDRQGRVQVVYVGKIAALGEDPSVTLPTKLGLTGFRAVGTQLEHMAPADQADLTTLLQYRLDALVTLVATAHPHWSLTHGEHPKACDATYISLLKVDPDRHLDFETEGPWTLHQLERQSLKHVVALLDSDVAPWIKAQAGTDGVEKALLLGLAQPGKQGRDAAEDLLDELSLLAKTAGATVVGREIQSRVQPDPRFYVGQGKAQALAFDIQRLGANLVIADDELSPAQQRALERVLRTRVIDRAELILDIFAQRAQSWEGKIQVELAQLQYLLPRLTGRGVAFSQQTAAARGGTIATRGPGETKLELDRRRMRTRITELERQAESVRQHRRLQRKDRLEKGLPVLALVGYTNAGKSTLLNTLTQAGALSEDKLFATLDPLARRLVRPGMPPCVLVDTVGFIQKLPTTLVKAFLATLEEIQAATLIFHVVDLSHPDRVNQIETVQATLHALECASQPQWILLNKTDRVKDPEAEVRALRGVLDGEPTFLLSAKTGQGITELLEAVKGFLQERPDGVAAGVLAGDGRTDGDAARVE